jgi:hypothetical protein
VVVELLSKEVQKAREEMQATQLRLKEIEAEDQALRQQSARAGPEMTAAAQRQHILNQMRFLSEYDLASPDVPFVVDDLDKYATRRASVARHRSLLIDAHTHAHTQQQTGGGDQGDAETSRSHDLHLCQPSVLLARGLHHGACWRAPLLGRKW